MISSLKKIVGWMPAMKFTIKFNATKSHSGSQDDFDSTFKTALLVRKAVRHC